jgi:hypothetical protein
VELEWEKPVIVFYRERTSEPEREPFAVAKARRLVVTRDQWNGRIEDFFPLMGNTGIIGTEEGRADRYILCWPDDEEEDERKVWKRLMGVTFIEMVPRRTGRKASYNAVFRAENAKIG